MKNNYFSAVVLLLIVFVQHSNQQNFNPLSSLSSVGNFLNGNSNESVNTTEAANGSNNLVNTIRNTTSNLFSRLESPRDRVIEFIKPAVKSDLSRNITSVLNSIWGRLQGSNISLVQNPYFKSTIIRPINFTLERLTQMTAAENEHAELNEANLEIINLNTPEEEQQFREYLVSSASTEGSNPIFLLITSNDTLNDDEVNKDDIKNDDQLTNQQILNNDNQLIESKPNEQNQLNNEQINVIDKESNKKTSFDNEKENQLVNSISRRAPRFMDSYTMIQSPDRMRNFFNRVREQRMRECLGLAICESNCSPHLYGGDQGTFRRFFDRFQSSNLDHEDYDYYLDAGRHGQRYYSHGNYRNDCRYCHRIYNCPHERQHLINSFSRMGNFY